MVPRSRRLISPVLLPLPLMLNWRVSVTLASVLVALAGCFKEPKPAYKTVDPTSRVYLSDRGLVDLPEINKKAVYLNLDRNSLGNVDRLADFAELKWLRLNSNTLSSLPDLSKLTKLRRIYLKANRFESVPDTLKDLPSLTDIDLSSNPISEIPDWLAKKPGLLHLSFTRTRINRLPNDLSAWKSLKSLQLGELHLSAEEMSRIRRALPNVAIVF